jgi:hypothetical protein
VLSNICHGGLWWQIFWQPPRHGQLVKDGGAVAFNGGYGSLKNDGFWISAMVRQPQSVTLGYIHYTYLKQPCWLRISVITDCFLDNKIWCILIWNIGPQEMDYRYLLGTCPPECSLPPLCKCQQRWRCSYLGCFFKEMYHTQWPRTCSNMCKMGWRWCDLYRVFLLLSFQFLSRF